MAFSITRDILQPEILFNHRIFNSALPRIVNQRLFFLAWGGKKKKKSGTSDFRKASSKHLFFRFLKDLSNIT